MNTPRLRYAQARIQARHALLLDEAGWQRLEPVQAFPHFLRRLREGPLGAWLQPVGVESGAHQVEQLLQRQLDISVAEVAGWLPEPWRPAAAWLVWVPELPLLAHLLAGQPPPPWCRENPRLAPLLQPLKDAAWERAHPECALWWAAGTAGEPLWPVWKGHWRTLWPPRERAERERLASLLAWLEAPRRRDEPAPPRERLEQRLGRAFRRHGGTPAAAFIHLALVGLQLERLRGALVSRRLFPAAAPAGNHSGEAHTP